jgi:hypothetical protein
MKRLLIVLCVAASCVLAAGASAATTPSGGLVHVYGISHGANHNDIIITGAFAAKGLTSNVGKNTGLVTTPGGTFKVDLTKLNKAPGHGSLNPKTCSGAFQVSAPITFFDGTGSYVGISGGIKLSETFAAIVPRLANGKCNQNANPISSVSFFTGSGTVSF